MLLLYFNIKGDISWDDYVESLDGFLWVGIDLNVIGSVGRCVWGRLMLVL